MKTLVFVAVVFGIAHFASPPYVDAQTMASLGPMAPPIGLHGCRQITDYAIRCQDDFGNTVTCAVIVEQFSDQVFRRWECN